MATSSALYQNYPNPFNPSTNINLDIPTRKGAVTNVSLIIYNALGKKVRTLFEGSAAPGHYSFKWNGLDNNGIKVPSGFYFYVFSSDYFYHHVRKMSLIK